jgi:hypothetical protein
MRSGNTRRSIPFPTNPLSSVLALVFVVSAAAPTTSPTPLKTIERTRTSLQCTLLRENVVPSVGAVLRNDIAIAQAGTSVDNMVRSIIRAGSDSPYGTPGVALAQVQLLSYGQRLIQNTAEVDRRLSDSRFNDPSDPELTAIRDSLEQVSRQQEKLLNVIFGMAYSDHPAALQSYGYPIQDEVRDATRREPADRGGFGDIFNAFVTIANENIGQTRALEDTASARIVAMAPGCGYKVEPNLAQATAGSSEPAVAPAALPESEPTAGAAARAFYADLARDRVDRSRLSSALDHNLTPSILQTLSAELSFLGTPSWQYVGTGTIFGGRAMIYRLSYRNGVTLYYGYGASPERTIFAIFVGTHPPPDVSVK